MKKAKKMRISEKLIDEGWFADLREIEAWVMLRRVLVDGEPVLGMHELVPADGEVRIREYYKTKYVNKGGLKLEKALADFSLDAAGAAALDCGASAGGFTDCLLRHGARLVYAVDAGHGQLAGKLLNDSRAVNLERTNISDARLLSLDPKPEIITLDLSYLSLKEAVAICAGILAPGGVIVSLIKPIYEVDSPEIRRSGKINDAGLLRGVLEDLCAHFTRDGWHIAGITNSPIRGNRGTLEFFAALTKNASRKPVAGDALAESIERSICAAMELGGFDKSGRMA